MWSLPYQFDRTVARVSKRVRGWVYGKDKQKSPKDGLVEAKSPVKYPTMAFDVKQVGYVDDAGVVQQMQPPVRGEKPREEPIFSGPSAVFSEGGPNNRAEAPVKVPLFVMLKPKEGLRPYGSMMSHKNKPYKVAVSGVDTELLGLLRLQLLGQPLNTVTFQKLVQFSTRYYTQWDVGLMTSTQQYETILATCMAAFTPDAVTMTKLQHLKNKKGTENRKILSHLFTDGYFRHRKVLDNKA